ncbi:unknown [Clostridium sp. CAG:433]|mgnify:FL=1|nr:unknown [Clostridium sp. CAG:433]
MENNKKKILDEINNLYGDTSLSDSELELIEKVSENDEFTNEAIELMKTQRSKYNDIVPTKENETDDILMIFSDVKNRMGKNSVTKTDYNMDKILEVTNRYFEGNKDANLTDLQIKLLRSIAEYDDATNNLVIWLNDAIENDEERNMENYIDEATNAYEDHLSRDEARKFAQDLKKLNPDVDIKLDKKCTSIDISKPINELDLPENFYLDENNRITNKENTALSVFVSLKVNEVRKNNKNAEEEENMNENEEREEQIINDDDFLDEFSTSDRDQKRQEKKKAREERRAKKQKAREEKRKNKKTKSNIGFFKKIINFFKNKFIMPDDLADEEINLDNDFDTEELDIDISNKDSKEQNITKETENKNNDNVKKQENKTGDNTKKPEEPKNVNNTKKDEEVVNKSETPKENVEQGETKSDKASESHTETVNTTLSAGENLKRIAKIRSEIERLQRNKEELKNIQNASKFAKEETAKHYDEETKKLRDQIKEIVDNNKYTNEAGREISMEERDRFDRLDAVQADIIETVKKQKQINSEFNEAWYGHMGEKVSEDLLKRRSTLKNELDAINIKLNLLKQKREEIVAENPMTHARTM